MMDPGGSLNLQKSFDDIVKSESDFVPSECGFDQEVINALILYKDDPTPEHLDIAKAALKAQIDGDDSLTKAIDEYLAVQ